MTDDEEMLCVCGVPITPCAVGYTHSPRGWMGNCNDPRPADESKSARYTYDPEAGATYVYLRHPIPEGGVAKTAEVDAMVNVDYDADGEVIGIEIIGKWPDPSTLCPACERCTWNPGPDCGKADHPHCPTCGHCEMRHVRAVAEGATP
ncbi:DUF2283 domain-containing protein [Nonomuraea sp. NPDC026600]|uniref:DUF2283 domain-containing protein n=1 Tax=Nonomuraea sp. NPDC026600 TaxID=3155363 RepID=UPI0033E93F92